jgi:hypothetical protein
MNKRMLISEEEKQRILDMHKSLSLKPILELHVKGNDVLNSEGQYITQGDVVFTSNGTQSAILKSGSVVWGDQKSNSIVFWNNKEKSYKYRELLSINCDSDIAIGKEKNSSGNWEVGLEYQTTNPTDFIPKMKSMFCCGTKLKPEADRPESRAWAKAGEEGYKCGKKCPSGKMGCSVYHDCSKIGPQGHYHMCSKCEKIKELQRCLAEKFPNDGIKDDGAWGCKTQAALDKLKMGDMVEYKQIELLCTTTLG